MTTSFPGLETARVLGGFLLARRRFTHFRDRAQLARWQRSRLIAHLRWTARHSPFYRVWFAENDADPADPAAWPRMEKAAVTANLPALLTRPVDLPAARALTTGAMASRDFAGQLLPGGITAGLSSGTTGPAALFLVSARERAAWAGLALARTLRGVPWGRSEQRVAFFLRANSPLYETVGGRRALRFAYFDLLTPLTQTFPALEDLAPTVLVAPPGALRILAAARRVGELRITPVQVVSVAETLDADDRTAIQTAFGVRAVDEVYQATEGFLAATCPAGALHWNEDAVHVEREPLGDDDRYHPVLTDFRRQLQPFVRYRLDDIVTDLPDDAPPCPCGSVFRRLRRIEGRQDDALRLPRRDGAGSGPLFPDFARLAVAGAASAGLEDFRVRQTGADVVSVSLRPALETDVERGEFLRRLETHLAVDCARAGLRTPTCRLARWPENDANEGAKRRRVIGPGKGPAAVGRAIPSPPRHCASQSHHGL